MKLTSREIGVISLVAEGKTCVEIGEELNMTQRSLEIYKAKLLKKTATKNLPHLISWFYTRYFKPNIALETEYQALQERYEKLRKLCVAPVESNRVEHKIHNKPGTDTPCPGCLTKVIQIRRLEDELHPKKRNW